MKTRFLLPFFLAAAFCLATAVSAAARKKKPKEPDNRPALTIVVVDALGTRTSAVDDYVRLDIAFQELAKKRAWPMKVETERFAANEPEYETELRIYNQPIRQEVPGELTFRAWVTLTTKGKKSDFGIVKYSFFPNPGRNSEDTIEELFRGAAKAIAAKVEPVLFPDLVEKKK